MRSVLCSKCGARIRVGRKRCFRCLEPLQALQAKSWQEWLAKKRRLQLAASALVAVLLALVMTQSPAVRRTLFQGMPDLPTLSLLFTAKRAAPEAAAAPVEPAHDEAPAPTGPDLPTVNPGRAGVAAFEAGDYAAALVAFEDAVGRNPEDMLSQNNLGQALVRLGRVAEAVPHFDKAIAIDGRRATFYFNRALAFAALEQWPAAVSDYREAVAREPASYANRFNLAQALHKQGDELAAVEAYEQAIALNPNDAAGHLALGISLEALERTSDAAAAYERYIALAPNAANAPQVRARISRLTASAATGDSRPGASDPQ